MPVLSVFRGEKPLVADYLLNEQNASTAINCNTSSGALVPWRRPLVTQVLSESVTDVKSLYFDLNYGMLIRDKDTDYVQTPVPNDQWKRLYYTDNTGAYVVVDPLSPTTYPLGVPSPSAAPTLTVVSAGSGTDEWRSYTYTWVTQYGEESQPAPPTTETQYKSDSQIKVTAGAVPAGRAIDKWRIYRTATGASGGTQYQFVEEVPATTTEYTDVKSKSELGAVLKTTTWSEPPSGLLGLINCSGGFAAAFKGNTLYFSVPYQYHAWDLDNTLSFPYQIVGLGVFGNNIAVLTDGRPYIVTGTNPSILSKREIADFQPCASKRGIVSALSSVIYPSREGICVIDQNGLNVVSRNIIGFDAWDTFSPDNMHSVVFEGKYFGFSQTSDIYSNLVFDFNNGDLTRLDIYAYAGVVSQVDGDLYVVIRESEDIYDNPNPDPTKKVFKVVKWDSDDLNNTIYTWKSKRFIFDTPTNLGAAKVTIDLVLYEKIRKLFEEQGAFKALNDALLAEKITGPLAAQPLGVTALASAGLLDFQDVGIAPAVNLRILADSVEIFNQQLTSNEPIKLPKGEKAREFEFELKGNIPLKSLVVADSISGLRVS